MVGPYALLKEAKISVVMNPVAAGTTEQKSSVIDMAGYDSVMFILSLGTVTAGCVETLTIYGNTASSTSSPAPTAITNAVATYTDVAAESSNTLLIVDVLNVNPDTQRYVFADFTRTTANAVINGVYAIRYNSKSVPQTLDATVIAAALAKP